MTTPTGAERIEAIRSRMNEWIDGNERNAINAKDLRDLLAIAEAALEWYTVYHDDNSEDGVNRVLVDACRRFREGK